MKLIGKVINGYKIINLISEGGNSFVFKCEKEKKQYAIKIAKHSPLPKTKLKRFKNEISFIKKSNCPQIIKYIDDGEVKFDKKYYFLVMPLLDCSFKDILADNSCSIEEKISYFLDVCKGCEYAHSKGIIHRDIKPENILIDKKSHRACLSDFGIAHFKNDSPLTKPKDKLANFSYASPEQREFRNEDIGTWSDIYSLGLILNEIFTHELANGDNYKKIVSVAPKFFEFDKLVSSMLRQSTKERTSHVIVVQLTIERILNELNIVKSDVEAGINSIGRKNKNIFAIAIDDVAIIYNFLQKQVCLNNVNYNYHGNIRYQLSERFLNSLYIIDVLLKEVRSKREYDITTQNNISHLRRCGFKEYNKLKRWLLKLKVLDGFEKAKYEVLDRAYFLVDYHFEEFFKFSKSQYQIYKNEHISISITEIYDIFAKVAIKYPWLRNCYYVSLFSLNYRDSNEYYGNEAFFLEMVHEEEEIFNFLLKDYSIVVTSYIDEGLEKYLLTAEKTQFDKLIEDIRKAEDKLDAGDVRVLDFENIVNEINDVPLYSIILDNSTIVDWYELKLLYSHLKELK